MACILRRELNLKNILKQSKTKEEKRSTWEFAFGLIKIDGLEPTDFLKELAEMEIEGKITNTEILELLIKKYKVTNT